MFTRNPMPPSLGEIEVKKGHTVSDPGKIPVTLPANVPFMVPQICSIC